MQDTVIAFWKTITKSLFSKPACKMYPAEPAVFFERTRGRIEIEPSKCIVCTLCAKKCPTGAIVVDKGENFWQIDRFRCILCSACAESCKPGSLTMVNQYTGPVTANELERFAVTPPKPRKKKPEEQAPAPAEGEDSES